VPDDLDRIPVALVPRRNRHKRPILAAPHQVNNLTMPGGGTCRRAPESPLMTCGDMVAPTRFEPATT